MINRNSVLGPGLTILLVFLILAMLIGQQFGQPIVLGFVATGSMSPALEAGDGFIAIPPAIAGDVGPGDVITFEAEEIEGGGLTTHRIAGETSQGYVTVGDANPFTDQDAGEPHVQDEDIVAVALQLNGEVVRIPYIGTFALAVQGVFGAIAGIFAVIPFFGAITEGDIGTIMVLGGIVLLLYSIVADVRSSGKRDTGRNRSREGIVSSGVILLVILLLIVGPATASMVLPSDVNEVTIISSSSPSTDPLVIQRGQSSDFDYNITHGGYLPRVAIIEPASEGVEITQEVLVVSGGESAHTIATVRAPDETGAYDRAISERQYIGILPTPIIVGLHQIHPWVAIAGINMVIIVFVTTIYVVAVGLRPFRFRSTDRNVTWVQKVQRQIRKWK